jgi:5-formyltetrahydrofolate cyclo-ligase
MQQHFGGKPAARREVWTRMGQRFGRTPRFEGEERAAHRLLELPILLRAKQILVARDAVLRPLREHALARGIEVFVPTRHLSRGLRRWANGDLVDMRAPPAIDLVVTGSVAVMGNGYRCGTGDGIADLTYAILRALGRPPPPLATIIDPRQRVSFFPTYEHDVSLDFVATPEDVIAFDQPAPPAPEILWDRLEPAMLTRTPILQHLARTRDPRAVSG